MCLRDECAENTPVFDRDPKSEEILDIFNIALLSVSGLLLAFIGSLRLTNPIKTFAKASGITLDDDVDLLSEARGIGGTMMLCGGTMIAGAFIPVLTPSSFVVATVIFFGFAVGRSLGYARDGKPNKQLIQGLASELILGSLNAFGLYTILS
jgi:hypothetical protein